MRKSPIAEKAYKLGVNAIKLAYKLQKEKQEYVVSRQYVRAATSIGANYEESQGAQSDKDFYTKICICYKEARETKYWLELLIGSELVLEQDVHDQYELIVELVKMLGSAKQSISIKLQKI